MNTRLKIGITCLLMIGLTACFEVEDNRNNDGTVDALKEQNDLLRAELNGRAGNPAPVTLFGVVIDGESNEPISNGKVTLTIGSTPREPIPLVDGFFEVDQVPANSSYELFVEGPEGYLSRAFYGDSRSVSGGSGSQDVGLLNLHTEKSISFSVIDEITNKPVVGLVFRANYHIGESSRSRSRQHVSSYDSDTGKYSIALPRGLDIAVFADIDLNRDGEADYGVLDQGTLRDTTLSITSQAMERTTDGLLLKLFSKPANSEYELRISILDTGFENVKDLEIVTSDRSTRAVYDESSSQYVLKAKLYRDQDISVLIPSFSVGDTAYSSSSVSIGYTDGFSFFNAQKDKLIVSLGNGDNQTNRYVLPIAQDVIDISISPKINEPSSSSDLEVVLRERNLPTRSSDYRVFYSRAIGLIEENISLVGRNFVTVIKGNDSPDDLVFPGTSTIVVGDKEFPAMAKLSLNNTLMTVKGPVNIPPGYNYFYKIGNILDVLQDAEIDLRDGSEQFYHNDNMSFDINMLQVDNNNYTTNGSVIVTANTAGQTSSPNNDEQPAVLFLPLSIDSLENFSIRLVTFIDKGDLKKSTRSWKVVANGKVNPSRANTVSFARNEDVDNNSRFPSDGFYFGTSLDGDRYYRLSLGEHLRDHTATENNAVELEYAYNVKGGAVKTGKITLPIR